MSKKYDSAAYLNDIHELASALVDYLQNQMETNHPDLDGRQSLTIAGSASIATGLSLLIGGARVRRQDLVRMINKQMDKAYEAINDSPGPDDKVH